MVHAQRSDLHLPEQIGYNTVYWTPNLFICAVNSKSAFVFDSMSSLCFEDRKKRSVPQVTVPAFWFHKGLCLNSLLFTVLSWVLQNGLLRMIHRWLQFSSIIKKNTQLCWEFVLSSHQPTVFRVTFGSLWKTGRANRTQYCFKSSGFGRSFIGSFTPGRPWWRPCWRTNRAYQDISISCWPLVDDFRCFRLVRHVHVSLFCLLWLVDLQTWVDLTRRRGCRPSGWAGQGGGHSEGRSRLRWWGNAVRGGAHREGWGTGLADGHVISEYGSPGA